MSTNDFTSLDFDQCLDDVTLAKSILADADKNDGKISDSAIVFALRNILKMKYYPVAVKYFFKEEELEDFKKMSSTKSPVRP